MFIVPGPVWVMLIAQSMQGGLKAGVAIALGVAIGDLIYRLALVSLNQIASVQWDYWAGCAACGSHVLHYGCNVSPSKAGAIRTG